MFPLLYPLTKSGLYQPLTNGLTLIIIISRFALVKTKKCPKLGHYAIAVFSCTERTLRSPSSPTPYGLPKILHSVPSLIYILVILSLTAKNMIFVSAEQSHVQETIQLFKQIYNGTPKAYPNGYMLLFIPLLEGQQPTSKFRSKVLFNHSQFLGEEAAFSIGGLQDLKTMVKLKNGNTVPLRTLIKSIPASEGMSRPQLFMQVEPNITGIVTMVTFQKADSALVTARQKILESEIRQVIANGEEDNVFVCNEDGIWFGGVNKTRTGRILAKQQVDRSSLEYTKKIE
jgi:hypothetical protein